jgi:hypothetical protein
MVRLNMSITSSMMYPKLRMFITHKEGNLAGWIDNEDGRREYLHETLPGWYAYQRQWMGSIHGWFSDDDKKMYDEWCKDNMTGIYIVTKEYIYLADEDDLLLFRLTWIE